MSFDQPFTDPLLTQKRSGNSDSPFLQITEMVSVINSKALLTEIPNKRNRVQITEIVVGASGDVNDTLDGGSFSNTSPINSVSPSVFFEIDSGIPTDNQYVTDYNQGVLTFNSSQEGMKCVVKYTGTGTHYFPASRVYAESSGSQVTKTLGDITDTLPNLNSAITDANQATVNTNNATANFQTLLDEQKIVYKGSVNTYNDISTTFPTPELGWMVVALDTGIRWRWDGVEWMNIGYDEISGFRVLVSPNPPINTNSLWVSTPVGTVTKNARVIKSSTAPSDTSVIWWQTT